MHTDYIDISNLPQACVLDRKELENIQPFGECKWGFGAACADKMILTDMWEIIEKPKKVDMHCRNPWMKYAIVCLVGLLYGHRRN